MAFQREFGLTVDGVIGQTTWYKIVDIYNLLPSVGAPPFPGTALRVGSTGESVRFMQSLLNQISKVFPVIPSLTADGIFGSGTQSAVIAFQRFFGLTADGVIGPATWNKIVEVSDGLPNVSPPAYPGYALRVGSSGNNVIIMQKYLNTIATRFPAIPTLVADGIFGAKTGEAVKAFQRLFGLTEDGVIGMNTWNMIVSVYNNVIMGTPVLMTASQETHESVPVFNQYDACQPAPKQPVKPMDPVFVLLAACLLRK